MKQYQRAAEDLSRAISLRPDDANGYVNRAKAHKKLGHYDLAIADYDSALRLEPGNSKLLFDRGTTHELRNDLGRAVEDYSQAISVNPSAWRVHYRRALVFRKMGLMKEAFSDLVSCAVSRSALP